MLFSTFLLLVISFYNTGVVGDNTTSTLSVFLDDECTNSNSSSFQAPLDVCIVIPSTASMKVGNPIPCSDKDLFATVYGDTGCTHGEFVNGSAFGSYSGNALIPDRCITLNGSEWIGVQLYCLAPQNGPTATITATNLFATAASRNTNGGGGGGGGSSSLSTGGIVGIVVAIVAVLGLILSVVRWCCPQPCARNRKQQNQRRYPAASSTYRPQGPPSSYPSI